MPVTCNPFLHFNMLWQNGLKCEGKCEASKTHQQTKINNTTYGFWTVKSQSISCLFQVLFPFSEIQVSPIERFNASKAQNYVP